MKISLIVAMGKKRQIGLNDSIPWHIPKDLENFKNLTMDHHIVMGRKTFESIGKPLLGRKTVVLTRDKKFKAVNCLIVYCLDQAIAIVKEQNEDELFICGGEQIYKQALDQGIVERIYLTNVNYDGEADTFFPEFDYSLLFEEFNF